MHCPPPKSSLQVLGEHLELKFRLSSIPLVLLLAGAAVQSTVVVILIPLVVCVLSLTNKSSQ